MALQTVNGDVKVRDLDGEVKLESVNGMIEVARASVSSLEAQTVNGSIDAVAQAVRQGLQSLARVRQRRDHADAAEERAIRPLRRDDERHDRVDVPAAAPGIGG